MIGSRHALHNACYLTLGFDRRLQSRFRYLRLWLANVITYRSVNRSSIRIFRSSSISPDCTKLQCRFRNTPDFEALLQVCPVLDREAVVSGFGIRDELNV